MRHIVVDGVTYRYVVGSAYLKVRGFPSLDKIKGSWDLLERGQRKGTSDGMVTPADVASYIQRVVSA